MVETDIREELDGATLRPFHGLLIALVFVAITFDGYDIVAPSYVIHFVAGPWHLSPSESGFLVSAGLIGVMAGSLAHGVAADRFGRRPVMIAGLLFSGAGSLVNALAADSYGSFVVIRMITGIGLGVIMPLGTAYINEYLPSSSRYRLASLAAAGFSLGAVLASVVGIVLTPTYGWQVLFIVGAGAALVGLVFIAVFPESAEFLVLGGRVSEAAAIMARVRPERAELYRETGFAPPARSKDALRATDPAARQARDWLLPLRKPYRVTTVALWLSALFLLFDNYGLTAWTPSLMIQRGAGFALGFGFGAALHSLPFLGGILCGYVADRWLGRRVSLVLWCGLGALSVAFVVLVRDPIIDVAAIAAAGFFLVGSQFMLNNVCAMTYPVHARSTGLGYLLGVGRIGAILGPYLGGVVLGASGGTDGLFVLTAVTGAMVMVTGAFIGGSARRAASPRSGRHARQR
jgi:MFS family permease